MKKTERLIYILVLLRNNRQGLRAASLARKCGVSERTIYRDIISLSLANIPIYNDNGYKLLSEYSLPPCNFSDEEANFTLDLLKSSGHSNIAKRVINKIKVSRSLIVNKKINISSY